MDDKLIKLEKRFERGEISRRRFIVGAAALGAALAAGPSLLPRIARAEKPRNGGTFTYAIQSGATTDSLDPIAMAHDFQRNVNWQLRNCLVEIDNRGMAIPELAESWESSPDAKRWTFKLRKGVEFHNGKTLDAKDVIWSIKRHQGSDSKSPVKSFVKPIREIRADGPNTVVFELDGPDAGFPYLVADGHLAITPADNPEVTIGTGGYKLIHFEPGVTCQTRRNPNYWKEGRAHFDEIETRAIGDAVARMTALRTGRIDAMATLDVKTARLLKRKSDLQVLNVKSGKHVTYPMLTDLAPFDQNNVRLAMKYAIDREQLIKVALGGYGSLGNDHPIAPTMAYYAADLPQRPYDPDKARFLMKKAGLSGRTFKLHVAKGLYTGSLDAAILYKEQAAKAAIDIDVVRESKDGYWKLVWMRKPWCSSYWSPRPTADLMFNTCYSEDSNWNESHWKNPRFNRLLVEARGELDQTKRAEMYFEMQKLVSDEGGSVIPFFFDIVDAASKNIRFAGPLAGNFELDGARAAERWWFAA